LRCKREHKRTGDSRCGRRFGGRPPWLGDPGGANQRRCCRCRTCSVSAALLACSGPGPKGAKKVRPENPSALTWSP
jgi:hypothetical protein